MYQGGTYLRGLWKQKPQAWGPVSAVSRQLSCGLDSLTINPFCCELAFNFWGPGSQADYSKNKLSATNQGVSYSGNRLFFDGYNSSDALTLPDTDICKMVFPQGTILCLCNFNTIGDIEYPGMWWVRNATVVDSGFLARHDDMGENALTLAVDGENVVSPDNYVSIGKTILYAATWDGSDITLHSISDTTHLKYSSSNTASAQTSTILPMIGNRVSGGRCLNGEMFSFFGFSKALSDYQIEKIAENPYKFFQPPTFRTYFIPSAATPIDIELSGSVSALGSVSGDIAKTLSIDGSVSATGNAVGSIDIEEAQTITLVGEVSSIGTISGKMLKTLLFTGGVAGSGSVVSTVSLVKALQGSVTAQIEVAGDLVILTPIEGDVMATFNNPGQFLLTGAGTITITTDTKNAKVMLSNTGMKMPYVQTEDVDISVPVNYPTTDRGPRFHIRDTTASEVYMSELLLALYGTDGTDAQSELNYKWRPMFDTGDIGGTQNIVTANDESTTFIYYDDVNKMLKASDGTNTSEVSCSPISGTAYIINVTWNDSGLQISVDDVVGTLVTFAGSIPVGDYLSFGWEAEAPQYVKQIKIEKEAEELQYMVYDDGELVYDDGELVYDT